MPERRLVRRREPVTMFRGTDGLWHLRYVRERREVWFDHELEREFIDADQFEREQRDRVIRELMALAKNEAVINPEGGDTWDIWYDVSEWLESFLSTSDAQQQEDQ